MRILLQRRQLHFQTQIILLDRNVNVAARTHRPHEQELVDIRVDDVRSFVSSREGGNSYKMRSASAHDSNPLINRIQHSLRWRRREILQEVRGTRPRGLENCVNLKIRSNKVQFDTDTSQTASWPIVALVRRPEQRLSNTRDVLCRIQLARCSNANWTGPSSPRRRTVVAE